MNESLIKNLRDARRHTLELIHGLNDEQLMGIKLATVNPLRWEIGHVAHFHEFWILRRLLGRNSYLSNSDELYDSIHIPHDGRWDLPLPSLQDTLAYMQSVQDAQIEHLEQGDVSDQEIYLTRYATYHEDMHTEAFTYTRQTLNYPPPTFENAHGTVIDAGPLPGDAQIPGGRFMLGARRQDGFCFDNEKWAHEVVLQPFKIARAPVINAQFAEFVDAGGYTQRDYWSDAGWAWREQRELKHPVYWRRDPQDWVVRQFDQWRPLSLHAALIHVSWYEAQAYCRWADRRLPTEAEWEAAAAGEADGESLSDNKRQFPWGDTPPNPERANLDGLSLGCVDVTALPDSDSAFGCRQMIGNVWEWTDTTFGPYPGFTPDMYQDYSQPLFGGTKVLRGGAWTTRSRMIRNTWRNYYGPDRNDVFAGFRTCAL